MSDRSFLYGSAWKEGDTQRLVELALANGFRAIDTANQRAHYHEAGVGDALEASGLKRDQVFLQTKFTFLGAQDHRRPYDPSVSVTKQVQQSFESSLVHLKTSYIDSYLLHAPSNRESLTTVDLQAWSMMETLVENGLVKRIGVCNVTASQLEKLLERATIRPQAVQNRCFANRAWDAEVRAVCHREEIEYQGFSLLTANPLVVSGPEVGEAAERLGRTRQQVVYRFAQQLGMRPLAGTKSQQHMREALEVSQFDLTPEEMRRLGAAGARSAHVG